MIKNLRCACKIALLAIFMLQSTFATGQKVKAAIAMSPTLSWLRPDAGNVNRDGLRFGVDFGVLLDIHIKENQNYAIATGLTMVLNGGGLSYEDSLFTAVGDTFAMPETSVRLQYINLPVGLKLKTNEIGYITYYGVIGLIPAFRVRARADMDVGETQVLDNQKISSASDDVPFSSNFFNLSLNVGGGIEYSLNGNTALIMGLFYHNGFLSVIDDNQNDRNSVNTFGVQLGLRF